MITADVLHFIARAIAKANGHPEPDTWASAVVGHAQEEQAPQPQGDTTPQDPA